ncbi:hypothetical protein POPTR_008G184500v4 [Populus trichocarpa]|uniref:Uncharacterized protein n=1 Tax=Populus trichocarpa TaxID=3694 RepID=A0ACC0SMQ9_POPTR|nr:hypothetical protein POPTR_008G184500v4 [Populus trichocarpa]
MFWHPETNPHFIETLLQQLEGQDSQTPPSPGVSLRQDQQNQLPHGPLASQTRTRGHGSKTKGASVVQPKHEGQFHCTWITPQQQTDQHPESPFPQHDRKFQSPWVLPPQPQGHPRQIVQSMTGNPIPTVQRVPQAQFSGMPRPVRTKPITCLGAVFCTNFCIVIFLGGLSVLIVYLVYRPRSPRKVSVDFSYLIIDLYYGRTLIASQASEQISRNGVLLDVKGVFRVRSKLGSLLWYS